MQSKFSKLNTFLAATASLCLLLAPAQSRAGSSEYALTRVINVGILRIPSSIPGSNQSGSAPGAPLIDPYIFDILNNRPDVKPSLWKLVNPLAPATVDTEVRSRYPESTITNPLTNYPYYTTDQQVTPSMAPYWEVDLSKISSGAQLSQFNLLVIRTDGDIVMNVTERRVLRQYIDQGGTLWIDGTNTTNFDPATLGANNTLSLSNNTNLFRVTISSNLASTLPNQSYNPIATSPYSLPPATLNLLGHGLGNSNSIVSEIGGSADPTLFEPINGAIVAGDYGSGHVIIDDMGICDAINAEQLQASSLVNIPTPSNPAACYDGTNYAGSPAIDLQFLVNVISYATSSATPGANVRGNGNQASNTAGSLTSAWQTLPFIAPPSGIATYGKFVYVTSGSTLACYDVNPGESIFSDAKAGDDGVQDFSTGSSYDMIWQVTAGSSTLSPPVVALIPDANGIDEEAVLVEDSAGAIYGYHADYDPVASGNPTQSPIFKLSASAGSSFSLSPPGPTYYRGEIFAPQASGNLNVFIPPFSNQSTPFVFGNVYDINSAIEPLHVASVPSTDGTYSGDEIVGYAVSPSEVRTIEIGSRDEALVNPGGVVSPTDSPYSSRFGQISPNSGLTIFGAPEDTAFSLTSGLWVMDFVSSENNGNTFDFAAATSPAAPSNFNVDIGNASPNLYSDYDVYSPTQGGLSSAAPLRTTLTSGLADSSGLGNAIQGVAVGQDNVVYMTVNEAASGASAYIEAVKEQAPAQTNSTITWRFALTGTTAAPAPDASGITYDFGGYRFIGAPIVGNNGLVYALATNGTITRLLAFNTNPQVGIDNSFNQRKITQIDEFGASEGDITNQFPGNQISNFAPTSQGVLSPSITAPGTVIVQDEQGNTPIGSPVPVVLNTAFNGASPMLAWYTALPVDAASAPRMIGDYIYFGTNGQGTMAVLANPARIGLQPDNTTRLIPSSADYRFVQVLPTHLGNNMLPPAATDRYLVSAETTGIEGYAYTGILVADGNRIIEMDPSGNATWTMDSTEEHASAVASTNAGVSPIQAGSTSVSLNRPSTVAQLNANDYLIADTGNNRVVHADRGGNVLTQLSDENGNLLLAQSYNPSNLNNFVISPTTPYNLEISSFKDPYGLLGVGEPLTLNQPRSVVTWSTYEYANGIAAGDLATAINQHYLIADTGNGRVLDIVDRYIEVGTTNQYALYDPNPVPSTETSPDFHYLNWVSHTSDIAGHSYGYVSAEAVLASGLPVAQAVATAAYPDGGAIEPFAVNQATAIIAAVGDKSIAALDTTQSTNFPTNYREANGSSILLLNYTNGFPYSSTLGANGYKTGLPSQLVNSVIYANAATGTEITHPLRGLRSAIATTYTPGTNGTASSLGELVIADDDGVFDGTFAGGGTSVNHSGPYLLDATYGPASLGWCFTQYEYDVATNNIVTQFQAMEQSLAPVGSTAIPQSYANTTFLPASAVPVAVSGSLSGHNYLIVNRGASGDPNQPSQTGAPDNGFGGNVFTVHANVSAGIGPTDYLDGWIYGRPANTGALSSPSFALRSE